MEQVVTKNRILKKTVRIIIKTLIGILLLLLLLTGLVLLPPVQTFIVQKAAGYLEGKIHTPVSIGRLYIGFPKTVVVEKIYLQDKSSDTLLYAGSIKIDIGLFNLIRGKSIDVNDVALSGITAKVNRLLPDTSFNFQYIIDAFASGNPATEAKDTSAAMPVRLGNITLDKIHAVYKDVVTGYDAELNLGHFDTHVKSFDLEQMDLGIGDLELSDVFTKVYQSQPLPLATRPAPGAESSAPTSMPRLQLGVIRLKNINADYKNDVDKLSALLQLGNLSLQTEQLDLSDNLVVIKQLALNSTTAKINLGKKENAPATNNVKTDSSITVPGWHVYAKNIEFNNNFLQFDDANAPVQKTGMDYMHLKADSFTLHVNDFVFSNDTIAGKIPKGYIKEKSGFYLQQLQTDFIYTSGGASLSNLHIKTPGTEIKKGLSIRYPSLEAFQKNLNTAQIQLDIDNSKVQVKDILTFVPALKEMPAFANPDAYWFINSNISGTLNNLNIRQLQLSGLQDTRVDVQGRLKGMPDINKLEGILTIKNISSSKRDLLKLIPAQSLPNTIALPDRLQLNGNLNAAAGNIQTVMNIASNFGKIDLKGNAFKITDAKLATYNITLNSHALNLGALLKDTATYGPITATLTAKGKGLDAKTMNAEFSGNIASAILNHYNYKDLQAEGSLAQQQAAINAAIADPNIHLQLNATANLAQTYPAVQLQLNIDSIKTKELRFTQDDLVYRGMIEGDFSSTNPDSLAGKLFILQSLLVHNQHRVQLDTLQLTAEASDTLRKIEIKSDVLYALLQGNYHLTQMGDIVQHTIHPYFNMDDSLATQPPDYDFTFNAHVPNAPQLKVLLPDLKRMDSISLTSRFSSGEGVNMELAAPAIYYGTSYIDGFKLNAVTQNNILNINAAINKAAAGESMVFNKTNINAAIANNKIDLSLRLNDPADKQRYFLRSNIEQVAKNNYNFSLAADSLVLNYNRWKADPQNIIRLKQDDVNIDHFNLIQNNQQLSIQSTGAQANAPVQVTFKDFKIATLTAFVQPDTTLANGTLNGQVLLENILKQPVFTGDLSLNDVSIKQDTIGNLQLKVDNKTLNTYAATVQLNGRGNDMLIKGDYYTNSSSFDANITINQLPMKTIEALSAGALREASGNLKGNFDVTGTVDKPVINGALNFEQAGFVLSTLNNYFKIEKEQIDITNDGIRFNKFQVKDSANNQLVLDGTATTSNFRNYVLDLSLRSDNFRALNSTQKDNQLFWGKLYFDSNLKIKGTESAPVVDGRLKINDKTDMTLVMPQNEPGVVEREGIVVFIDRDAPVNDSMFLQRYDSLNTSSLQGMNISVNVETDKKAKFKLIVDQGTGDALAIQGGAQLTAGVEPGGKIGLAGVFEIEDGSYNLNFNLLKRNFKIEKNSKITWEGEPTSATVAITAKYTANTSALDLVKNQLSPTVSVMERNTYLQKLPFQVLLKMEGALMQPKISFDIILPEGANYNVSPSVISDINTKLAMLRQDDAEMNKQVFALLLLNRFVAEDPFSNSNSTSTTTLVMQSVSKFMSEQLNQWAQDLIKGIDINFDLQSTDDFSSGERESRTDLNVGLSKRLLNDRLTVSVGSNFELDGPKSSASNQQGNNIAGNITIDYRLTEDGRYMLRGYRKNNYQGVIEGYIIETGIGFVITMDYNRFREIFEKRKDRKQIRAERRAQRRNDANKKED